jgi:hypothetical protein
MEFNPSALTYKGVGLLSTAEITLAGLGLKERPGQFRTRWLVCVPNETDHFLSFLQPNAN